MSRSSHLNWLPLARVPLLIAIIFTCAVIAGCGSGNDGDAPTPTAMIPAATVVQVTPLSGTPRLGEVVWSNSVDPETKAPINSATPVIADQTIYAVLPIESLPAGSQLIATWFFNDTSLDALSSPMRIDHDRSSGWVEFHIDRTGSEPWPDGVYEIVVTDGTNELQRSEVSIS